MVSAIRTLTGPNIHVVGAGYAAKMESAIRAGAGPDIPVVVAGYAVKTVSAIRAATGPYIHAVLAGCAAKMVSAIRTGAGPSIHVVVAACVEPMVNAILTNDHSACPFASMVGIRALTPEQTVRSWGRQNVGGGALSRRGRYLGGNTLIKANAPSSKGRKVKPGALEIMAEAFKANPPPMFPLEAPKGKLKRKPKSNS